MVALLVAVVGVLGTLTSPVIAQRMAARTRREEFETQRRDSLESRERDRREALEKEKKAAYIAFYAASRRYRVEVMNYLHAIEGGGPGDTDRAELREARRAYSLTLAEVQIMATDTVMKRVEEVTSRLSLAFNAVKRIEDGAPLPDWSFEETRDFLTAAWDHWVSMRHAMREDLGLEDQLAP